MLAPGAVLADKYLVDRIIGQGGMATVVAATHLHLNEPVAIKMLLPELAEDPTIVERFMREARAAVRLKGEHVTRVIDVGLLPSGAPYIVMELLVGIDLGELLKARSILSSHEAVDCVLQVCEALAEAHVAGIVHRDIKPSNLFITQRPDGSTLVKVLDFGISKMHFDNQVSNLTQNAIVGTPSYMSPEQLRGLPTVDARTDIWSLGIVLYRLLAGHRPFKADSMSALAIQCATEPTPVFTMPVPFGLDALVYRCLQKEPEHRFQSVAELAYALAPYAGDQRAAQIVIERTQNILRWTPPPPMPQPMAMPLPAPTSPTPPPLQYPLYKPSEPTTLGSSVAAIYTRAPQARTRRRGWLIGGVAASIVGATIAAVTLVGGKQDEQTVQPAVAPPPSVTPIEPPTAAPMVEPKVETKAVEPVVEPKVESKAETKSEPKVESKAEPKAKSKRELKAEAKQKAESKATETKPKVEPTETKPVETKVEPKPEPKPKSDPLDTRM